MCYLQSLSTEGIAVGLAAIAPKADFSSWPRIGRVAASNIINYMPVVGFAANINGESIACSP